MHVDYNMQVLKMMSCKVSVDPLVYKASVDTDEKPFSTDWTLAEMISTTELLLRSKLLLRFLENGQMVDRTNDSKHPKKNIRVCCIEWM